MEIDWNKNHEDRRRLVVYIGPPKTASTTLQTFLATYASPTSTFRGSAFEDWSYPMFFGRKHAIYRMRTEEKKKGTIKRIRDEFRAQSPSKNLVVASEHLIYFDTMHKGRVFKMFSEWTNISTPEVVVHSRSPRTSQLISLWKQNAQSNPKHPYFKWSFRKFMCANASFVSLSKGLDFMVNPIGVVNGLIQKHGLPTYYVDMEGITEQQLDICHVFACSILRVKCTDGNEWVQGINRTAVRANIRKGDPAVSPEQFDKMEHLFRQRDCAYGKDLFHHPLFRPVYHSNGFWPNQCSNVQAMSSYRHNSSVLLHDLRTVLECPGYESGYTRENESPPDTILLLESGTLLHLVTFLFLAIIVRERRLYFRKKAH
eukprot:scaffold5807_cov54-Cylindrotheca_fusiformis.AAC.1